MRVLLLVTNREARGGQVHGLELARGLVAAGHDVETVALVDGANPVLGLAVLGRRRWALSTLRALRRRMNAADVVIANGSTTLSAVSVAGLGCRVPVVYRQVSDPLRWASSPRQRMRVRWYYRRVDHVVAISDRTAAILQRHFGVAPEAVTTVPNAVPNHQFRPATQQERERSRRHLDLDPDGAVIVYVGALAPEKRVELAVEALRSLPDAQLVVVGDGPLRGELERHAAGIGAGRVRFTGALRDPTPALAAADVLILPSDSESMPAALIEAGLAGLPVIATDVGDVSDVVVDDTTGRLVPPGSAAALADALRDVLADPTRRAAMGEAARRHCRRFTIDETLPRWLAVLDDVADLRGVDGPVRVLWLTKGLGGGGAERLIALTAPRVDDRFAVEVAYVLPVKSALVPEIRQAGITVHALGEGLGPRLLWPWRLLRLLRRRRFRIVHTHSPASAVVARLVSRGAVLVHTEHSCWERYRLATRAVNAITYWRNDAVIAVSAAVATSIRLPRLLRPPVEVVHHGIDQALVVSGPAARTAARTELDLPDGAPVVGTVGNLTPKKDHATLLRAFALVAAEVPDARLVIVGGGPLERQLRDLVEALGLVDRVLMTGQRLDVPQLLPAFDVFALASRHEGLGIVLLEAMSAGIPVVATRVGGIPEVVTGEDDGVLVPPEDPLAMAAALTSLLTDPVRAAALAHGARCRSSRFSIDGATRRTVALYDRLLDHAPR